jgi:hypothetical protein
MIACALLLALAAASRVELADEVYSIPADNWRYLEVGLKQQPAVVVARYDVDVSAPRAEVRVSLMRREDMEHLRQGLPHGSIENTEPARSGTLRAYVPPGDYVLVVDNRASHGPPSPVHLHVWLDFTERSGPIITTLPPERQLVVVVVSFAVFFTIVGWSGRRLLRAVRK